MKFNLYSIWGDPVFYAAAIVFASGMFFLVFSIRKYLEMKNRCDFEESGEDGGGMQQGELPLETGAYGAAEGQPDSGEAGRQGTCDAPQFDASVPDASLVTDSGPQSSSKAEEFVKGLYQNLASLDGRLKNIEAAFSKANVNRDFTVTFLGDMIAEFDALDKEKIKARIEYLLSDLKK